MDRLFWTASIEEGLINDLRFNLGFEKAVRVKFQSTC